MWKKQILTRFKIWGYCTMSCRECPCTCSSVNLITVSQNYICKVSVKGRRKRTPTSRAWQTWSKSTLSHPGVGERGIAILCVELQSDESDLRGNAEHLDLHRLILRDAHVLESSRQENHTICNRERERERKVGFMSINHMVVNHPIHVQTEA